MEYRDIVDDESEQVELTPGEAEPFLPRALRRPARFDPIEEQVIALARRDGLSSLTAPGWIDRFVAFAFGIRSNSRPLADPRLETLRRAVIVARHRHHLPDAQAAELRGVGFMLDQIHAIESRANGG